MHDILMVRLYTYRDHHYKLYKAVLLIKRSFVSISLEHIESPESDKNTRLITVATDCYVKTLYIILV